MVNDGHGAPGGSAPAEALHVDADALDALFSECYQELRRRAASLTRRDSRATVNPTTLVHEAWLKLQKSPGFTASSLLHFQHIAARAMHQILVEAARRRTAQKRGGKGTFTVTFDGDVGAAFAGEQILALDLALEHLARVSPRQAQIVEYRFFAGMEEADVARLLQISKATVSREYRSARAWLASQLESR
jgi:RNA polymerase sigma-70 factor, ECF subfamily